MGPAPQGDINNSHENSEAQIGVMALGAQILRQEARPIYIFLTELQCTEKPNEYKDVKEAPAPTENA